MDMHVLLAQPAAAGHNQGMLTGAQCRAARALLRLKAQDLADMANVGIATINRIERVDELPSVNVKTLARVRAALEERGVEFINAGGYTGVGGDGVRRRQP